MADLIEWKEEYSVGVPELDHQHRGLIELINRLTAEPVSNGIVGWIFEELEAYTKDHFSTEERLLEEVGFHDLVRHRAEHRAFEQWLSAVRQTYSIGVTSPSLLSDSVNEFLREWLVSHILSSDMAYKGELEKKWT